MSGPWIDVSVGLADGMVHWPSNPPVKIERVQDMSRGDSSNVSLLSLGSHTGTHVDAPAHFISGGVGVDRLPFEATNGRARVIEIKDSRVIDVPELARKRILCGERILFKTANSRIDWKRPDFSQEFVYLSTQAGEYLVGRGVRAVGVDYLSVGGYHKNGGEIHPVLLRAGVCIIEGLDLARARAGRYELACLPLKIVGGDGAPARASAAPDLADMESEPSVLVVDVGGTNVKVLASGQKQPVKIPSGPDMTPARMVREIKRLTRGWKYERVSVGYPGPVIHNRPIHEPFNLGRGWVGFDFRKALGRPVKIINDAAMQALGSYRGGRMLFLGLGTGLGSAMIVDGILEPMELAHLGYKHGKTYEDYLGKRGLDKRGKKKWRRGVLEVARKFREILEADEVVLGGGNAKKLKTPLPPGMRLGRNENAFRGGFQLWKTG